VRFLVDESLSPTLCEYLASDLDTANHIRDTIGTGAPDATILDAAEKSGQIVLTADTDFGTLLARSERSRPSVVLVRDLLRLSVTEQGLLIQANLGQIRGALEAGAIVVITPDDIRVRPLPIL
jgi:predicted nuclease of predicted toxin-antitoxin system